MRNPNQTSTARITGNRIFAVCVLAVTMALTTQPATAQAVRDERIPASTPTFNLFGTPPRAAPPEWSGEPGASGHPLMTVDAIRTAAGNFRNCLEGLWHWLRAGAFRGRASMPPSPD